MSDIERTTHNILDGSLNLVTVWKTTPHRRDEFGWRELEDIRRAKEQLTGLEGYIVIHMNRKKLKRIA
jgi:hypothetical protein